MHDVRTHEVRSTRQHVSRMMLASDRASEATRRGGIERWKRKLRDGALLWSAVGCVGASEGRRIECNGRRGRERGLRRRMRKGGLFAGTARRSDKSASSVRRRRLTALTATPQNQVQEATTSE
eukprot:909526-Rhodomonas_salina.3